MKDFYVLRDYRGFSEDSINPDNRFHSEMVRSINSICELKGRYIHALGVYRGSGSFTERGKTLRRLMT